MQSTGQTSPRAVELPHRNQVEKIHQRAHVRDCSPYPYARGTIHRVGRERSAQPPERTGEPDARVFARVRRILLEPDHGAEPGDEHWRCGLDAVALQRLHVTHFVDIDGKNQAEREMGQDRKSTRLNSSHLVISYAVFCLKKKKKKHSYCILL